MAKYTFKEFQAEYPNDERCLEKLMEIRHGGTHISCPGCGVDAKFHLMKQRKAYACQECGHHIYPCAGSIFHKSRTKLTHWFFAMYMMTSTRHGVAAKEIQRQTGVTYKCAWRMCHELRKLMATADFGGSLGGKDKHVEIDEAFVGGVFRGKGKGHRRDNKTVIFGMVEREGRIRVGATPDTKNFTLEPIILHNVEPGTTISTDTYHSYRHLKHTYAHGMVNHRAGEYVSGIHHTNTIEGHWSLFKRAVRGTHVHVSSKHMWKYLCEFSYRRNMRHSPSQMFNCLVEAFSRPRLLES